MGLTPGSIGHPGICPYLRPEFDAIREWHGYTPERVIVRWRRRSEIAVRLGLGKGYANRYRSSLFYLMGVGNPYSTPHAHSFMVRRALKARAEHKRGVR